MKNKIKKFITNILFLFSFFYSNTLFAENVIINAEVVDIKEKGNLIIASGSVEITDSDNITITSEKAKYNKLDQTVEMEGNVFFVDQENNYRAKSNKMIFLRDKNLIYTYQNTEINLLNQNNSEVVYDIKSKNSLYDASKEILEITDDVILENYLNKFKLFSNKILFNKNKNITTSTGKTKIEYNNEYIILTEDISFDNNERVFYSQKNTSIEDYQNNIFKLSSFKFDLDEKIFKSKNLKLTDTQGNILELNNGYVDLNSEEIIGSDYIIKFKNNLFGNIENDPRLIGRYILTNEKETKMKKSSFTTCKNIEGKCPAWSISADEVVHSKEEKRISYKNAWLEIYDTPVAYFPYFYHPDPSVERQSGFLFPQFINSSNLGFSTQIPYFKAIDLDKDLTISPRVFTNNNLFLQTEYRQAFENSDLITDLSFNKKNETNSHFFTSLIGEIENSFYEMKIETVSNQDYLKKYQIESPLINSNTVLNSSVSYEKYEDEYSFSTSVNVIEDLSKEGNDKYEYTFPDYEYFKETSLNGNFFETFSFKSSGNYRKFDTNVDEADLTNDLTFSSTNQDRLENIETDFSLLLRNTNSYGDLSTTYKNGEDYKILGSAIYNLKYPLIKKNNYGTNYLTPQASLRYSPNKGTNLKSEEILMNFERLFTHDRINSQTVEHGASATLGFEFKSNENQDKERFNLGMGVNFRNANDEDLPLSSSLGQKTSDIIGYSGINITENLSLNYNFLIDQNLDETNYNLLSLNFDSNRFKTSFEYMEKSNTIGDESYLSNVTQLELNQSNVVTFETNKNVDKNLTDYYNLIYKYKNDCLEASVVYNKQFYNEDAVNSSENIFFKISFVPFGTINTPNVND